MQRSLTTHVNTITDSLNDEAESLLTVIGISELSDETHQHVQERLTTLELIQDRLAAGMTLTADDLREIGRALQASEDNCRELDLNAEADEYEAARIAVAFA